MFVYDVVLREPCNDLVEHSAEEYLSAEKDLSCDMKKLR